MYFLSGEDPRPIGNAHFVHVPYNSYPTADGFIIIAVLTDNFWENLLEVVDCAELRKDAYKTQPGRLADKALIDAALSNVLKTDTSERWLQRLQEKRIPCARINRFSQSLSDAQVCHRNMIVELGHPSGKHTRGPGNPVKLSRTGAESFAAAPLAGQDTGAVLKSMLGLKDGEIANLKAQGVIS